MGKVIVLISTTLDGFVDAQHVIVDPEFFEFTQSVMVTAEIGAFGRTTFEIFQERWPPRLQDNATPEWMVKMAQALHDIPKVVFSSTLKKTTWHNSTIINSLDLDYINTFKRKSGGALLTFGSLSLIESLTKMNVVDEYYLNVLPVLAGKGEARLFGRMNLDVSVALKFIGCKSLASGAHIIHYKNEDSR